MRTGHVLRMRRRPVEDASGKYGRRHLNKYAGTPPRARVWCNATNGNGEYCQLAPHNGPHAFGRGAR